MPISGILKMQRKIDSTIMNLDISDEAADKLRLMTVDSLGIPARAKTILSRRNIDNAFDAIITIKSEFKSVFGIGDGTLTQCNILIDGLLARIKNVDPEHIVSALDKRDAYFGHSNGNLVQVFPAIVDLYFEKKTGSHAKRNKDILYKRFDFDNKGGYTLEDIGTYYDLTRERVRQIEAKAITDIHRLLSAEMYTKTWRLDNKLTENYLSLKEILKRKDYILTSIEMKSDLEALFGDSLSGGQFKLFMEILGYVQIPPSFSGFRGKIKSCWCLSKKFNKKEIEFIFQSLDVIFDSVEPIKTFDLIVKAKRKSNKTITNESIHIALKSFDGIDIDDDMISINFQYLRSAADKAYRVLSSKGKPTHYSDLCKEINILNKPLSKYYKPIKPTNLKNQMVSDGRFQPIGRSGYWSLKKWKQFENITIVQAIESVLHQSGIPLQLLEIYKQVNIIRPNSSKNSVSIYLNSEPSKFTKVEGKLYALASWKIPPVKKIKYNQVSHETFHIKSKEILKKQCPVPAPVFIRLMMESSGLKESAVRNKLNNSSYIKVRKSGNRSNEVYCENLNFDINNVGTATVLLRDKVQSEIRSILYEKPNTPFKKGELYSLVNTVVQCQKPTFYQYLHELKDIKQYKLRNSHYAIYEHLEESKRININMNNFNFDAALMESLKRPISMLDIDNVDIALFEFGLIFENQLKSYLIEARNKSVIKVFQKDLNKLSAMIDCVVRERVVSKGHHLETLREERNNRAHGKQPSLDERKSLFNKAHYIAELFIKYIAIFNTKKNDIV